MASTGALRNALAMLGPRVRRLSLAFVTHADRSDDDLTIGRVALEQGDEGRDGTGMRVVG